MLEPLEAGVATGLVVVSAPAGTGKTQLVAEWADRGRASGAGVCWLNLDREDRDVARFARSLTRVVVGRTPDIRTRGESADPGSWGDIATFLRVASSLTRRVVVVLDDFHHVVGTETETYLKSLVHRQPPQLALVVITRIDPQLGQERLRLEGRLTELRFADLALTQPEVAALLTEDQLTLPDEHVRLLTTRTSGWVAAVRLVASALREGVVSAGHPPEHAASERGWAEPPDVVAYLDGLPSSEPALADYLVEEVYGAQRAATRAFLDRVCILDEVCGDLAYAVTGNEDGEAILAALARAQIVTPVRGRSGRWYEWNPLLAALLRQRLHTRSSRLEARLHRLASNWCEHAGRPGDAVEHAFHGWGERVAAAKLSEFWLDMFLAGQSELLGRILDLLDDQVISAEPRLTVARAFTAARRDDLELALTHARAAEIPGSMLSPQDGLQVHIMAVVVQLYAARLTGGTNDDQLRVAAARLLEQSGGQAVLLGRQERVERALLRYQLGAFETSRAWYDEAQHHVSVALAEAELLGSSYLQLSCHAELAELRCQAGQLRKAEQHAHLVLTAAERTGWQSRLGLTTTHLALAQVAMLRDNLETALEHLAKAESFLRPADVVDRIRIHFLTATAVCTTGKVEEGSRQLDRLIAVARGLTTPAWVPELIEVAAARHDACQGMPERGLHRFARLPVHRMTGRSLSPIRPHGVLRADLLLRCGRPEDALAAVDDPSLRRDGVVAYVGGMVIKAAAAELLGRRSEAIAALDAALRVAAPERIIQPFVAPGPQVRGLLAELLDQGTAHEALALEVLSHMDASCHESRWTSARSPYFVDPLSGRELEVLEKLQSTMTNAEIAGALFVSVNTLRTHMKNINRKLGASDRRDAVRRARELRIL